MFCVLWMSQLVSGLTDIFIGVGRFCESVEIFDAFKSSRLVVQLVLSGDQSSRTAAQTVQRMLQNTYFSGLPLWLVSIVSPCVIYFKHVSRLRKARIFQFISNHPVHLNFKNLLYFARRVHFLKYPRLNFTDIAIFITIAKKIGSVCSRAWYQLSTYQAKSVRNAKTFFSRASIYIIPNR